MSGFVVVSCGFDVGRLDTELLRLEHVDSLLVRAGSRDDSYA